MIREMSPIEVAAMDVAHDVEIFRTYAIRADQPENVHPGKWIANSVALGLLLWGCSIWWWLS